MKMLKTSNFMLVVLLAGTFVAPVFAAAPDAGKPAVDPAATTSEAPKTNDKTAEKNATEEPGFFRRNYDWTKNKVDEVGAEMPLLGERYGKSEGWSRTGYRTGLVALGTGLVYGAYKLVNAGLDCIFGETDSEESKEEETEEPVAQAPVVHVTKENAYQYCSAEQRKEVDALLQKEKAAAKSAPVNNGGRRPVTAGRRRGAIQAPVVAQKPTAETAAADKKRKNELAHELMVKARSAAPAA